MRRIFALTSLIMLAFSSTATAQSPVNAHWVWWDEGNPAAEAAPGKVWFRKEVRSDEPSTGLLRIACDDQFVVWVNGRRVGEGGGDKSYRFNLNADIGFGQNVIAIEATNKDGKAGLLVDGEVRTQSSRSIPFDSGADWIATREAPKGEAWLTAGYDTSEWKPVKVLGTHEESPWKEIAFTESYLDRYTLLPGFELQRIGEPELVGSLINITWGNRGRLLGSREKGTIVSLIDDNQDGTFDTVKEFSSEIKDCQGLCMVQDELFAVGTGPQGAGIYRLADRNADDQADGIELVATTKGGMGEHGPHAVVLGPDGWLYHNLGNHAWIDRTPEATTAVRDYIEGDLLKPRFEDANGHAVGIPAPGGTVWRFTPDGKKWWLETAGFRNQYDIAFNAAGDLFTFDSDMEWDVALPWYRPVRINHCIPGAEFGWRSGAANWPAYYVDSLPTTADVGRGSPTGVVVYDHQQFPEQYRGSLLACDWSLGRIVAVHLKPSGASFETTWEPLISGNPLNVSDIEVDRDGTLIFATGGRGTEGGLYRVTYVQDGAKPQPFPTESLKDLVNLPQIEANWAREAALAVKNKLGDKWQAGLEELARTGTARQQVQALTLLCQLGPKPSEKLLLELATDKDVGVRAFVALLLADHPTKAVQAALATLLTDKDPLVCRRACEGFVRSGLEPPVEPLLKLLAGKDRWLPFAARVALERVPADKWRQQVLAADDLRLATVGLLGLQRLGPEALSNDDAFARQLALLKAADKAGDQVAYLDLIRLVQLTMIRGGDGSVANEIGALLLANFPMAKGEQAADATAVAIDSEAARVMAMLQLSHAAETLVQVLEATESRELQIHYALCLTSVKEGWTYDLKRRYLNWYNSTKGWEGGHSFTPYLANIVANAVQAFTPEEREQLLLSWDERPYATQLILTRTAPADIANYEQVMGRIIADLEMAPGKSDAEQMVAIAIEALTKLGTPTAQAALRKLFDDVPDRRDQLARSLANFPTAENRPYLIKALQFGDGTTLQLVIKALRGIQQPADQASEYRAAILAGLKLGDQGGLTAAALLEQWTGSKPAEGASVADAIAHYQNWFSEKYPEEPAATLAEADASKTKFTVEQLTAFLATTDGQNGDLNRGKEIFTKAQCAKCHRFAGAGEGIGPDLSAIRRRFQRKEIVESVILPSQVISDQYRSVTVQTVDGLIHTGMPVPQADPAKVELLLQDATRLAIKKDEIDVMEAAKISVMPEGLLKEFTLQDMADLFAYLETSKQSDAVAEGK